MERKVLASIVDAAGKITSLLIHTRSNSPAGPPTPPDPSQFNPARLHLIRDMDMTPHPAAPANNPVEDSARDPANSIKAGCIPCAIGHYGTCVGTINEAVRFARAEGIGSPEVIERTGICLDELNAMERIDLRPQKIAALDADWEKQLANKALDESRNIRHALEGLSSPDELVEIAAKIQSMRQDLGQEWFTNKAAQINSSQEAEDNG
jgi:hypothetical protein